MRLISVFAAFALIFAAATANAQVDIRSVNEAKWPTKGRLGKSEILKAQILLDRARFSPGLIDGFKGPNFRKAIVAYREAKGIAGPPRLDRELWNAIDQDYAEGALFTYKITKNDVRGPFIRRLPTDLLELADLKAPAYTSVKERLAEKFHMSMELLEELNPETDFDKSGTEIVVANVGDDKFKRTQRVSLIEVDKNRRHVRALDKNKNLLAFYPASVGSKERPAPGGETIVTRIALDPNYTYDPEFNWRDDVARKVVIEPGPNNPVGTVWIGLETGEGYGVHGAADPENVGKTASHGCVRLTNWDAKELASAVRKGTKVVFLADGEPTTKREEKARDAARRASR